MRSLHTMAKSGYRLAVTLVLLMMSVVVLIQCVLLLRLHLRTPEERQRAGFKGTAGVAGDITNSVHVANHPSDKAGSSGTSRSHLLRVQPSVVGVMKLAESNTHTSDHDVGATSAITHGYSTTREPQLYDIEAKNEATRLDLKSFEVVWVDNEAKIVKKKDLGLNVAVENSGTTPRPLTPFEAGGGNIMFTIRATHSYHRKRLPILFQTWLSRTNISSVILVTDGPDSTMENKTRELGIEYVIAEACESGHSQLCCKAGEELSIAFREEKQYIDWLCHVDDDMYILLTPLVSLLAQFYPKTDPVYLGRAGTVWGTPYRVKRGSSLGTPGTSFHFAVGGMYCLSRAMLDLLQPYLGNGKAFSDSCSKALEPEDVTLGLVVGAVLNLTLRRTELIHTHGLHLSTQVDPMTLEQQVAVSYGFGANQWGNIKYNAICVPGSLYAVIEDETQFKSLHCRLYPDTDWCIKRKAWVEAHLGGRTQSDRCKGW